MTPNEFERIGSGYLGIKQWCWKGMKLHCVWGGGYHATSCCRSLSTTGDVWFCCTLCYVKKLLPLDKLNNICHFLSITLLAVLRILRIFLFPQIWSLVTRPFLSFLPSFLHVCHPSSPVLISSQWEIGDCYSRQFEGNDNPHLLGKWPEMCTRTYSITQSDCALYDVIGNAVVTDCQQMGYSVVEKVLKWSDVCQLVHFHILLK